MAASNKCNEQILYPLLKKRLAPNTISAIGNVPCPTKLIHVKIGRGIYPCPKTYTVTIEKIVAKDGGLTKRKRDILNVLLLFKKANGIVHIQKSVTKLKRKI